MNSITRLLAAFLAATLLLAACGSDDDAAEPAADDAPAATDSASDDEASDEAASDDAASDETTSDDDVAVIEIADFAFSGDFDLTSGQTVQVVNNDSAPHTFTAADGSFDTGTIDPGASVTFVVPDAEGSIDVFCSIHPSMTARVTVGA